MIQVLHNSLSICWKKIQKDVKTLRKYLPRKYREILFYGAFYLRRKHIYKKVLSEIYHLIYYRYQFYRIFITVNDDGTNYGEYSQWGEDVRYEGFMQRDIIDRISRSTPDLPNFGKVADVGYKRGMAEDWQERITYAQFLLKRREIKEAMGISLSSPEYEKTPGTPSIELFEESMEVKGIESVNASWEGTLGQALKVLSESKPKIRYFMYDDERPIRKVWYLNKKFLMIIMKGLLKDYYIYVRPKGTGIYSLRKENSQYGITEKGLSLINQVSTRNFLDDGVAIGISKIPS